VKRVALALAVGILAAACSPQPPVCPSRQDDTESPAELAGGDACHRAGVRLQALGCPEARADWDDFCHHMAKEGVPICPAKIAKIAKCSDLAGVCR